jgi:hypothetical protein
VANVPLAVKDVAANARPMARDAAASSQNRGRMRESAGPAASTGMASVTRRRVRMPNRALSGRNGRAIVLWTPTARSRLLKP